MDELIRRGYGLFSWSELEEHRRAQGRSCWPAGAEWFKPELTEEVILEVAALCVRTVPPQARAQSAMHRAPTPVRPRTP
eukprot:13697013-Alexandrium_andersonii.AAC.2